MSPNDVLLEDSYLNMLLEKAVALSLSPHETQKFLQDPITPAMEPLPSLRSCMPDPGSITIVEDGPTTIFRYDLNIPKPKYINQLFDKAWTPKATGLDEAYCKALLEWMQFKVNKTKNQDCFFVVTSVSYPMEHLCAVKTVLHIPSYGMAHKLPMIYDQTCRFETNAYVFWKKVDRAIDDLIDLL